VQSFALEHAEPKLVYIAMQQVLGAAMPPAKVVSDKVTNSKRDKCDCAEPKARYWCSTCSGGACYEHDDGRQQRSSCFQCKLENKGGSSLCEHDDGRQQRSATTVSQAKLRIKELATATIFFAEYAIGLHLLSPEAATAAVDEPSAVPAGDDSALAEFFA